MNWVPPIVCTLCLLWGYFWGFVHGAYKERQRWTKRPEPRL